MPGSGTRRASRRVGSCREDPLSLTGTPGTWHAGCLARRHDPLSLTGAPGTASGTPRLRRAGGRRAPRGLERAAQARGGAHQLSRFHAPPLPRSRHGEGCPVDCLRAPVGAEPMTPISTIIMAGGMGTRMRSPQPKVLHELCGLPMLAWVARAAREAGAEDVVVVAGPETAEPIAAALPDVRVVVQSPANGTGHAVAVGLEAVPASAERVVVLSGDTPLIEAATIRRAIAACADGAGGALVSARLAPPHAYGRIVRDGERVARIVEARDATRGGARARRVQRRPLLLPPRRAGRGAAEAHAPQRPGRALPDGRHRPARGRRSGRRRRRRARAGDGRGREHARRARRARGGAARAHPARPHAGGRAHRRSRRRRTSTPR